MAVNPFFNKYDDVDEQNLLDQLTIESIQIGGIDCYYVPRRRNNFDRLYGEDSVSSYDTAYVIEMYVESTDGFQGGSMFSPFGYELAEIVQLSISITRFRDEVTSKEPTIVRPQDGDLVYFPLNETCFTITYVDNKDPFYQVGYLPLYKMTAEIFKYSNERFSTGIAEIDQLQTKFSNNLKDYDAEPFVNDEAFAEFVTNQVLNDPLVNNEDIDQKEAQDSIIDFTENNPRQGDRNY